MRLTSSDPKGEVYEWPGGYKEYKVGELYTRKRAEELQHKRTYLQFNGTVRGLATGTVFCLQNDPKPRRATHYSLKTQANEYIVLSTQYDLKESPYQTLSAQAITPSHQAEPHESLPSDHQHCCVMRLTVQDKSEPFRPSRLTSKPRTHGPQTAVVVGPEGQEIWTNEHGQVKVQFQWDRYGQQDENSSCWIRVSSAWASNHFGVIQVPRIGDEVVVDFLNGDPDHPMITGRVYNSRNMPPWTLPEKATQMGIYSHSSPDGVYSTANAFRFEDKTGHEEVYVHAQKDQNIKVNNNYSKRIDVNKLESVGHNKGIEVSNNHFEVIGGDMQLFVGPTQKGRFTPPNAATYTQGIGNVAYELGKAGSAPQGAGTMQLSIEKNKVESIGNNHSQMIQKNKNINVMDSYYIDVSDDLIINAGKRILLKCGQSIVLMNPDGSIQINGKNLTMNVKDIIRMVSDMVKVN